MEYFWKKRNIVYFLASLLVIFAHNVAVEYSAENLTVFQNIFQYGLPSVAVPMFFVLSGVCFFYNYTSGKLGKKLKKRIKTLFVPYILWNLVGMVIAIIFSYSVLGNFVSSREMFEPNIVNVLEGVFLYKYNYVFWFVYNLIIFNLCTPIVDFCVKNKIFAVFFTIFCFSLPLFATEFLAKIKIDANFVGYYIFGCMIGKHYLKNVVEKTTKKKSIISLGMFLLAMGMIVYFGTSSVSIPTVVINLLRLVEVITLWKATDLVVDKIREKKIFSDTFVIYAIHPYIISILVKLGNAVLPETRAGAIANFFLSYFITVGITILIISLWKKISPRSYGVFSGNRARKV